MSLSADRVPGLDSRSGSERVADGRNPGTKEKAHTPMKTIIYLNNLFIL